MPDVAGYELEVVIESGGRDLQIGVGEDVAALLEMSAYLAEHASDRDVVRKSGDRRENTCLDVLQVAFSGRRAVGSLEELTDRDGAGELVLPGNRLEPIQIGW
jgi:hypothetical protein